MSNGFVVSATCDLTTARELAQAFGLDAVDPSAIDNVDSAATALAGAANVGVLLSTQAAHDRAFVALLQALAVRLTNAQLILIDPEARATFGFLPPAWPTMSLDDARARARQRTGELPAPEDTREEPSVAAPELESHPIAPPQDHDPVIGGGSEQHSIEAADEAARQLIDQWAAGATSLGAIPGSTTVLHAPLITAIARTFGVQAYDSDQLKAHLEAVATTLPGAAVNFIPGAAGLSVALKAAETRIIGGAVVDFMRARSPYGEAHDDAFGAPPQTATTAEPEPERAITPVEAGEALEPLESLDELSGGDAPADDAAAAPLEEAPAHEPPQAPPAAAAPAPLPPALEPSDLTRAAPNVDTGGPQAASPARKRAKEGRDDSQAEAPASAPADATAFAPKRLRAGTPELIRIVIHQPKDLRDVIKAARRADPRTDAAPQSMGVGEVALGAKIGVALEVKGAACDGALQRRAWAGAPLEFNFTAEAEAGVKQAVILARVFIDDAQIGALAFIRKIATANAKPAPINDGARLKRHKRVFLSYSSKDRETVAQIATAYQMAGVRHFWDRTGLKSGEQWGPRLRREIDACDLFHLCWSKQAAQSEWVEKEATHALSRQRRSNGKRPAITVQMLDGPPWAVHPASLDSINFDDFVRAAIVGYARGEGE